MPIRSIKNIKNGKAHGHEAIAPEMLKYMGFEIKYRNRKQYQRNGGWVTCRKQILNNVPITEDILY